MFLHFTCVELCRDYGAPQSSVYVAQLTEQITVQPIGLGPIQLMLICGFTYIKDQVKCLSEAYTVSVILSGAF